MLDGFLSLKPMALVPQHTKPVEGRAKVAEVVSAYRDAIQFVHDQTIRLMNKGVVCPSTNLAHVILA